MGDGGDGGREQGGGEDKGEELKEKIIEKERKSFVLL